VSKEPEVVKGRGKCEMADQTRLGEVGKGSQMGVFEVARGQSGPAGGRPAFRSATCRGEKGASNRSRDS
jgi:hypothetical protein